MSINSPSDGNNPFTQLLGINNSMVIAGYHNFFNNQGFVLTLPAPVHGRRTIRTQ